LKMLKMMRIICYLRYGYSNQAKKIKDQNPKIKTENSIKSKKPKKKKQNTQKRRTEENRNKIQAQFDCRKKKEMKGTE